MAKIRTNFVSNSSSCSFIVSVHELTCKQANRLANYRVEGWEIIYNYPVILGYTIIDNAGMKDLLKKRRFPVNKFKWYYSNDKPPKNSKFEPGIKRSVKKLMEGKK